MPKVIFSLIEQESDLRSNEKAYKFMVENQGQNAMGLLSITPRIPEQVELVEVKDRSLVAVKANYIALCEDLTEVLRDQIFISDKDIRHSIAKAASEYVNEYLGQVRSIVGIMLSLIFYETNETRRMIERFNRRFDAFTFKIERTSDAKLALAKFIKRNGVNESLKEIFELKTEQLNELEKKWNLILICLHLLLSSLTHSTLQLIS
jgi:hypothetical protein